MESNGNGEAADEERARPEAEMAAAGEPAHAAQSEGGEPEAESDMCEIEHDGATYTLPAALKDAFLMQADYTRKTQEVAALRKEIETERAAVREAGEEEVNQRARIAALDDRIARFAAVDWDAWENAAPLEAQKGWRHYQQLQQARAGEAGRLAERAQQQGIERQRETARLIEEGRAVLARDVEGWSPALAETLLETGVAHYGFERAEIEEFTDPRMVKVLHDAHRFHLVERDRKQAGREAAASAVRPAAKAGSGAAPSAGLDDRLSTDEWLRRREQQVRKRA